MPDFNGWIKQVKTESPELASFVTKLEKFFSETGFNSPTFEKAVNIGLSDAEKKAVESFTYKKDVEGK